MRVFVLNSFLYCVAAALLFASPVLADDMTQTNHTPLTDISAMIGPPAIELPKEPTESKLESLYKLRSDHDLVQIGYDIFQPTQPSSNAITDKELPAGRIHDDFVLNYGDRLQITLSGAINTRQSYTIDNKGLLLIESFPPISAAGRNISQVRDDIEKIASEHLSTDAFLSLEGVHHIDVVIAGQVKKPGHANLTAFHSIIDALNSAGGIKKSGSLRRITLIRNDTKITYDLYDLLSGQTNDQPLSLQHGDKIIVPPIGATVAITGDIIQSGIYELKNGNDNLNDILSLAGGDSITGNIRYIIRRLSDDGRDITHNLTDIKDKKLQPSDIIFISQSTPQSSGHITLDGYTRRAGMHALDSAPTLRALFKDKSFLLENTYPLLGLIKRWDVNTLSSRYIPFPLKRILEGTYDRSLNNGDHIILFSHADIAALNTNSHPDDTSKGDINDDQVNTAADKNTQHDFTFDDAPLILQILKEQSLFIRGAVRKPGRYPTSGVITLQESLAAAGGLSIEADTQAIEVTSVIEGRYQSAGTQRQLIDLQSPQVRDITLQAGDYVRVNQRFHKIADKSVLIRGEVKRPGRYDLMADDTLSTLIDRAGGLTNQAYADGALFSRATERLAEEKRYKSQARAIRQAIASTLQTQNDDTPAMNSAQIAEARSFANELEQAKGIGRITVEADPVILKTDPDLDILLETGDRIYIPRRSLTVRVSGEILSPAALQFRDGKYPLDYINEAGGFTYHADKERSFVLFPDGSAQPLRVSHWNHSASIIPPGSTIIIPRDPKPFDFIGGFKDVTQILSNLAISAIFIDDLNDND